MMVAVSQLWLIVHSSMFILFTLSMVSGQSSECESVGSLFQGCQCSKKLDTSGASLGLQVDCSSRGLRVIPNPNPNTQFSIYELKLNNNSITSLGDSILNNLRITKLDLRDNPIGSVDDHAFRYVGGYLKILILSGNHSSQPPKNSFSDLRELEDLTLANYNVTLLNPSQGYFISFTKLKHLTLDNWNLESLDPGSIQLPSPNRLQSLTLINLQHMQNLPLDELRSPELGDLQTLRISVTNIVTVTVGCFEKLEQLTELDLSNNKISTLAADCFNGVSDTLVRLSLSANRLTNNDHLLGLKNLVNLQQLDISFNLITDIPEFSMLRTGKPFNVYLHHNSITTVPENAFAGITDKLNTLDLSDNKIVNFQLDFTRFTQIESLILSHLSSNSPLVLPPSLGQVAKTLKQLSVDRQIISPQELWSVVGQLYMLEVLNLSSIQLTNIPNLVLTNLTNLKKLDLSNNSLKHIAQETLTGPRNSLKFLNLSRNEISTLPNCMFYQYTSYPIFMFVRENRLICDCGVKWLWNSIRNGSISIAGQEAVCSDNQLLINKSLDSFCNLPYTESPCLELYTTPVQKVTIFVEQTGPSSIKISWQLSDTTGLKVLQVKLSDSHSPSPIIDSPVPISSTFYEVSNKLMGNTRYEVCVIAKFNIDIFNCTQITIPGNDTDKTEQQTGLSPAEIGIIVGVILGVLVLVAIIAAIIYVLICHRRNQKKVPSNAPVQPRNFSKSELPSMNEETRTFSKPKRSRGIGGAEPREGMQVVAISDGQTGHGRVGRAHLLNSDGSFKTSRTSNSSSVSGQAFYENDHGPLPPIPNGQHSTHAPAGYYNKGFKEDSYDEIIPKRESVI